MKCKFQTTHVNTRSQTEVYPNLTFWRHMSTCRWETIPLWNPLNKFFLKLPFWEHMLTSLLWNFSLMSHLNMTHASTSESWNWSNNYQKIPQEVVNTSRILKRLWCYKFGQVPWQILLFCKIYTYIIILILK